VTAVEVLYMTISGFGPESSRKRIRKRKLGPFFLLRFVSSYFTFDRMLITKHLVM
jgi:hypothetical protein